MQTRYILAIVLFLVGAGVGAAIGTCRKDDVSPSADTGEIYRIVNPLAEVEVGEWALYQQGDGKTMRLEVVDVHPRSRVVRVLEEIRDAKTNTVLDDPVRKIMPNHFLWGFDGAGALVARIYQDRITVAGHTFNAFCVETSAPGMGPVRHWYSPEVPVLGLIRQQRLEGGPDSVNTELLDWSGRSD